MKSTERLRFSIDLNEDFLVYGINPDEDLDDWSFLDTKPEPIPEKTIEEQELFNKLLEPTIIEEDINRDIHDRLKNLLRETTDLISINEDVIKTHISKSGIKRDSIENLEETLKNIPKNTNSFQYERANKVRNIVKSLLNTSEKADDISSFIESVTQSDKIEILPLNLIKHEEQPISSVHSSRFLPSTRKEENENLNNKNIIEKIEPEIN